MPADLTKVKNLTDRERAYLATPSGFARGFLKLPLYETQAEALDSICKTGSKTVVLSGNEVGKTSHILAPAIIWHTFMHPTGFSVSTAGVWRQVTTQLIPAMRRHAQLFPTWKFGDHSIQVDSTQRYIGFSTREGGMFEGYHGDADNPLLIAIDEAKTVGDSIFDAAEERCNPQRLLVTSSPGGPAGRLWSMCGKHRALYQQFRLSQEDCPHISRESIARKIAKWGRNHPLVRSSVFGEFTDQVEGALIGLSEYEDCLANPPVRDNQPYRHVFCDFAAGRDENVLAVSVGNKTWIEDAWRETNTMSAVGRFVTRFQQLHASIGLQAHEIEGDADGLGKPMVDAIQAAGWQILPFHGGSPPMTDPHYRNRWSEVWYRAAEQIKRKNVILPDDEELLGQAISRKGIYSQDGRLWLMPKEKMVDDAGNKLPSPDRADAVFGAMGPLPESRTVSLVHAQSWVDRVDEMLGDQFVDRSLLVGSDSGL